MVRTSARLESTLRRLIGISWHFLGATLRATREMQTHSRHRSEHEEARPGSLSFEIQLSPNDPRQLDRQLAAVRGAVSAHFLNPKPLTHSRGN